MLLILAALFMLFVGLLKMPVQSVQSILVQNRQEKHDHAIRSFCGIFKG